MSAPRLLVDAGNSRVKWARAGDERWTARGVCGYDDLGSLVEAAGTRGATGECWIASVAGETRNRLIEQALSPAGVRLHWLEAKVSQCGVVSHYEPAQQLGVDRWMALLAARRRCQEACLVVSAGTAMTVDALDAGGHFLGGLIVAGRALMEDALHRGTALVEQADGEASAFPRNTADAVRSGAAMALAGAVSLMHARLSSASGAQALCLLTGGDAGLVAPLLPFPVTVLPELVLEGILLAAQDGGQR
jgi:type III pantothenate kinase